MSIGEVSKLKDYQFEKVFCRVIPYEVLVGLVGMVEDPGMLERHRRRHALVRVDGEEGLDEVLGHLRHLRPRLSTTHGKTRLVENRHLGINSNLSAAAV